MGIESHPSRKIVLTETTFKLVGDRWVEVDKKEIASVDLGETIAPEPEDETEDAESDDEEGEVVDESK